MSHFIVSECFLAQVCGNSVHHLAFREGQGERANRSQGPLDRVHDRGIIGHYSLFPRWHDPGELQFLHPRMNFFIGGQSSLQFRLYFPEK